MNAPDRDASEPRTELTEPVVVTEDPDASLAFFVLNLTALLFVGVAISAWLLYFTDSFAAIGSVLGLGGLLAWTAFVSGLLPESRKKALQAAFERAVLLRHHTWLVSLLILIAFTCAVSLRGTLVLNSVADATDRTLSIAGDPEAPYLLHARTECRILLSTPMFGTKTYRLAVSGLPSSEASLSAFRRTSVFIPSSLRSRPVVLIRPAAAVSADTFNDPSRYDLTVRHGLRQIGHIKQYAGQSVWLGADPTMPIPESTRIRWRIELLALRVLDDSALLRWSSPTSIGPDLDLPEGSRIQITLNKDGSPWVSTNVPLRVPSNLEEFFQEVLLDVSPSVSTVTIPHGS